MRAFLVVVLLLSVMPCLAQQFTLKDADGKQYGPFDLKEGTTVQVGQAEASISEVTRSNATNGPMIRRSFRVIPSVAGCGSSRQESQTPEEIDWKDFFQKLGVSWPDGSSIRYMRSINRVDVKNTRENLEVFESILQTLDVMPSQIEIQMEFVAFDMTNIAQIASGGITASAITSLWTNGYGQLIAAPRVVTQSGVEATIKGVTECIYPTEFEVSSGGGTNGSPTNIASVVEPGSFETRETGTILQVLPEVSEDGDLICLTFAPEVVEDPEWRDYGSKYLDSNGKEQQARMEQPFFHTYSVSTIVIVEDGKRILASGGMPSRDGKRLVYVFVTARLIGIDGEPIKREARDRELE